MADNLRGSMNNYKGVMLCARPNEVKQFTAKEKPFCSRVDPKQQLGVNPVQKDEEFQARPKRVNEVLKRHKDWLQVFKLKMKYKKEMQEDNQIEEQAKFEKIKEQAAKDRERTKKMKQEFQELNKKILNELDENEQAKPKQLRLTENNLKKLEQINNVIDDGEKNGQNGEQEQQFEQQNIQEKQQTKPQKSSLKQKGKKQKPKWAYTEEEIMAEEEQEADDLLNFVDNLDYDKYIDDLEVQTMIKSIKNRVEDLKQEGDWKTKAKQKLKEKRRQELEQLRQQKQQDNQSDIQSKMSYGENRSVASERTQQSIQSLKQQAKEQKEGKNIQWDKTTIAGDNKITVEEKIAKLVADEVLRNYKHLGSVHSNQSIRKLLEKEAGKFLQPNKTDIAQRYDGPNITIVKERTLRKNEIDPNTLPYMHRNPAI